MPVRTLFNVPATTGDSPSSSQVRARQNPSPREEISSPFAVDPSIELVFYSTHNQYHWIPGWTWIVVVDDEDWTGHCPLPYPGLHHSPFTIHSPSYCRLPPIVVSRIAVDPLNSQAPSRPATMADKQPSGTKSSATLTNNLLSSPPRAPSSRGKERRNPSITPRKFQKFFTPRSRVSSKPSAARRALRDLADSALNRCQTPSSPLKAVSEETDEDELPSYRGAKRRKFNHNTPDHALHSLPSPLNTSPAFLSSPGARPALRSPIQSLRLRRSVREILDETDESETEEDGYELPVRSPEYKRPVQLGRRGFGGQLLERMTGGMSRTVDRDLPHPIAGKLSGPIPNLARIVANPDVVRLAQRDGKLLQQTRTLPLLHQP